MRKFQIVLRKIKYCIPSNLDLDKENAHMCTYLNENIRQIWTKVDVLKQHIWT